MQRTPLVTSAAAAAIALLASTPCAAQDSGPTFDFSGFATLGLTRINTDLAEFAIPGQPKGVQRSADADRDTKLGLQATARLGSQWSATVQAISKYNGEGSYSPDLEWAFVKGVIGSGWSARVGRMGLPAFSVSDFRDVNYANLWTRPPLNVYGQVPVSHFDGADLIWQGATGPASTTVQLFGGRSKAYFEGTPVKLDHLIGLNASAEFDNGITLRVGHLATKLTVDSTSLPALLGAIRGTPFAAVADQIDPTRKKASFTGIGLGYDQGGWVASAEYTKRKTDSYVSDTTGWYGSLGYRVGQWTPYVVLSQLKVDDSNVVNTIPTGIDPGLTVLSMTVDGLVATQALGQRSSALGLRWDVWRNTALKFQWEHTRTDGGKGLFVNPQPGFGPNASVNALSLSVDVVF